jgi:hypothetical protein
LTSRSLRPCTTIRSSTSSRWCKSLKAYAKSTRAAWWTPVE